MNNRLKASLDGVRAGPALKADTTRFVQDQIALRQRPRPYFRLRRRAAALASAALLLLSGAFGCVLYFTPSAYVDVDVNPSLALVLNRFDRVVSARAYNADGRAVLDGLSLRHKSYADALPILMDALSGRGFLPSGAPVSVTLQTDAPGRERALLDAIETGIAEYLSGHAHTGRLEVYPVSGDTRRHSHAQGVSPARYLAIQALIEVDPAASVESCRGHSLSTLEAMTRSHGGSHGSGSGGHGHGGGH